MGRNRIPMVLVIFTMLIQGAVLFITISGTLSAVGVILNGLAIILLAGLLFSGISSRIVPDPEHTISSIDGQKALILDFKSSVLSAEDAGRRMASQVGNSSAFISRISGESSEIARQTAEMADKVVNGASAMEEIQASIESLARQISRQGNLVHESAAAIEEMVASIASVRATVEHRTDVVNKLESFTLTGREKVLTTQKVISEVGQSVGSVGSMIQVIDEIAARTNLLAMNAAIEAAHAGSYGHGFAVVAQEIRKLAASTAENAHNIAATLKQLVGKIKEAEGVSKETGEAFSQIEAGAGMVNDAFFEIHSSARELDAGAQEMLSSTGNLSSITDTITRGADEMRQASAEITAALLKASEMVSSTSKGMERIRSNSEDLNSAAGKITGYNISVNKAIQAQIDSLNAMENDPSTAQARQRLVISNVILEHLHWLNLVREVMTGRLGPEDAPVSDPKHCKLGIWLEEEGKNIITQNAVYQRLTNLHLSFHRSADYLLKGNHSEELYSQLLNGSQEIVEILSSIQDEDSVRWTEDIAVNVELFDGHHRNLLQMIDRLYQALKREQTHAELKKIFDDLLDYTGYHFNAEIEAMEHYKYPGCGEHRSMHEKLVKGALSLRKDLEDGKPMIALEVKEFLKDWVVNHIQKCDKLYTGFFQGKDLKSFFDRRAEYIESGRVKSRA